MEKNGNYLEQLRDFYIDSPKKVMVRIFIIAAIVLATNYLMDGENYGVLIFGISVIFTSAVLIAFLISKKWPRTNQGENDA